MGTHRRIPKLGLAGIAVALCLPAGVRAQEPEPSADLTITSFTASHSSIPRNKTTRVTYYLAAKNNGPDAAEEALLSLLPGDVDSSDAHTVVSTKSGNAAADCLESAGDNLPQECKLLLPAGGSVSMAVVADVKPSEAGKVELVASIQEEYTLDPKEGNNDRTLSLGVGASGSTGVAGDPGLFGLAPTIGSRVKPGRSLIAFSLTRAARVRFTVSRRVKGRRKGRRCVAGRRRGKHCKAYRYIGSFTVNGALGRQTVLLPKRVRGRRLLPGTECLLTVQARDAAGLRSPVYRRKFKVRKN